MFLKTPTYVRSNDDRNLFTFFLLVSYQIFNPFPTYRPNLTDLQQTTFENTMVKGESTHYRQFSTFATMFSTLFNNNYCTFI